MKLHSYYLVIVCTLIATACATQTKFYENGKPNYQTWNLEEHGDIQLSSFGGNEHTTKSRSYIFSRLGAIAECSNKKKLALILGTLDKSSSATYLETITRTTPINTKRGTQYYTQSNTSPVTTTFPYHSSVFKCVDKFMTIAGTPVLEPLGKELVSPFTGDFKGGVLVKSPNLNKVLQVDDLIFKANNVRVENLRELTTTLADAAKKTTLNIYRNKKELKLNLNLDDKTDELKASIDNDILAGCAEVEKDRNYVPDICGGQNGKKPVDPSAPIDESKLSNKEIKRLRNQQKE